MYETLYVSCFETDVCAFHIQVVYIWLCVFHIGQMSSYWLCACFQSRWFGFISCVADIGVVMPMCSYLIVSYLCVACYRLPMGCSSGLGTLFRGGPRSSQHAGGFDDAIEIFAPGDLLHRVHALVLLDS